MKIALGQHVKAVTPSAQFSLEICMNKYDEGIGKVELIC